MTPTASWLSLCYSCFSVAIHFTWKPEWSAVRGSSSLPVIEKQPAPYKVRPHWGKLFAIEPKALRSRYERLGDFKDLASKFDPRGKFRNEFLARNLYGLRPPRPTLSAVLAPAMRRRCSAGSRRSPKP